MQILLTNDDGIFAPGLAAIYKELTKLGNVLVVAPAEGRSGASHSITFSSPLVCNKVSINGLFTGYSVIGSPADCVKLAVRELYHEPIDLVVSGINYGANAGINVYYSGTVAAAIEGAFLQIPSVALSLSFEESMDFEQAAKYFTAVITHLIPIKKGTVININMPKLSNGKPKGVRIVPHSSKGFDEVYTQHENQQGQTVYELNGKGHSPDEINTDIGMLEEGFITITALKADMTDKRCTEQLKNHLENFNLQE